MTVDLDNLRRLLAACDELPTLKNRSNLQEAAMQALPALLAEVERLKRVEAAARAFYGSHPHVTSDECIELSRALAALEAK